MVAILPARAVSKAHVDGRAGRNRLACFGARDQGRCDNLLTIRRDEVEARVLKANAARREELKGKLAAADAPPPLLHPEMAELYRVKVSTLAQETRAEATEALRGLID